MVFESLTKLRARRPLIHTLTNFVSINDCANILLACGARPVMAEDPLEVSEIAAGSDAVVLNLGMPNPRKIEAMELAAKAASAAHIPVVFDPVGVGSSSFRREAAKRILQNPIALIRGNSSEIAALLDIRQEKCGVDSRPMELSQRIQLAHKLSRHTGAAVAVSGETDVAVFGSKTALVHGGCAELSRITATGCMLTALCGAFLGGGCDPFSAAVSALCTMGVCGQMAARQAEQFGVGSMHIFLIDAVGNLTPQSLEKEAQYEIFEE